MLHNEWLLFVIGVLVTWRVTHLFTKEDGPFNIMYIIRKKAGAGFFGSLLDCFYCTSLWIAFIAGFFIGQGWKEIILLWLAFSGAACLLEKATKVKDSNNIHSFYKED